MQCFKKCVRPPLRHYKSGNVNNYVRTAFYKKVMDNDESEPQTIVTFDDIHVSLLADKTQVPKAENYRLSVMLRQGFVPEAINVKGMFASDDPLDVENAKVMSKLNEAYMNDEVLADESIIDEEK